MQSIIALFMFYTLGKVDLFNKYIQTHRKKNMKNLYKKSQKKSQQQMIFRENATIYNRKIWEYKIQEKIKVKVRKTIVMQSHSPTKNCLHLAFHMKAPNKHWVGKHETLTDCTTTIN